jgi:FKBP-type peptidyl-prolyl cis-trans isomerase
MSWSRITPVLVAGTLALGGLASPAVAQTASAPHTPPATPLIDPQIGSYDLGMLLGNQLSHNGLGSTLSLPALERGLKEALAGKIPNPQQRDSAQHFVSAARDALATHNATLAREFLAKNSSAEGIRTLPSGLQYRVLAPGDEKAPPPKPSDELTVRYRASLSDGTQLDNSDEHPQQPVFRLNSVIQGWQQALSAMRPGAKWQVFVPPQLGYGSNSPPPLPPGALLVYELELVSVTPASTTAVSPRPGQ